MKRPAFQFYPADWRKDAALQSCSLQARGLWHEMLCIMHECSPYGHLYAGPVPMSLAQLGRLVGESEKTIRALVDELELSGVFSRSDQGAIYSRRMVKDERIRNIRAQAGKLGGNPDLLGKKVNQADNHIPKQSSNQEPTPSSSSSSSSSKHKPTRVAALSVSDLAVDGLSENLAVEFLEHRKRKKALLTPRAWATIKAEAGKAGLSPAAVAERCIARGWVGFEAEWVTGAKPTAAEPPVLTPGQWQ